MLLQTRLLLFVLHRLHLCIFVILCIQNTNRVSSVIVRWIWLLYCLYELWLYRLWYKCPTISYLVCKMHLKHYLPESHRFRKFFNYSQISKRKKTTITLGYRYVLNNSLSIIFVHCHQWMQRNTWLFFAILTDIIYEFLICIFPKSW